MSLLRSEFFVERTHLLNQEIRKMLAKGSLGVNIPKIPRSILVHDLYTIEILFIKQIISIEFIFQLKVVNHGLELKLEFLFPCKPFICSFIISGPSNSKADQMCELCLTHLVDTYILCCLFLLLYLLSCSSH